MARASIIIPSFNRIDQMRQCLTALQALEGGPYETIVVDDGSATPYAERLTGFGAHVRIIRQDNAGPGAARNTGAQAATGEYLCFVDDDCDPDPGWVDALVRAQGNHSMRLVGGKVVNGLPRNPYSSASQSLCSFLTEYYAAGTSEMTFFTTNNMCCRAEDFRTLAGFDPGFRIASEDRDFSLRWKEAGGQLVHAPEAVVHHSHVLSFASFWRQHQNYGLGARQLHLAMDRRRDRRPKIEPARFYFGLLFHPLRHAGHRRLYQSFLIGLSQVAMVSGYYRQVMKERRERGTGR